MRHQMSRAEAGPDRLSFWPRRQSPIAQSQGAGWPVEPRPSATRLTSLPPPPGCQVDVRHGCAGPPESLTFATSKAPCRPRSSRRNNRAGSRVPPTPPLQVLVASPAPSSPRQATASLGRARAQARGKPVLNSDVILSPRIITEAQRHQHDAWMGRRHPRVRKLDQRCHWCIRPACQHQQEPSRSHEQSIGREGHHGIKARPHAAQGNCEQPSGLVVENWAELYTVACFIH